MSQGDAKIQSTFYVTENLFGSNHISSARRAHKLGNIIDDKEILGWVRVDIRGS